MLLPRKVVGFYQQLFSNPIPTAFPFALSAHLSRMLALFSSSCDDMKYPARLDKFVSQSTGMSRSEVKKQLKAGFIRVNQHIEKSANLAINATDQVWLGEQRIQAAKLVYYVMNKPSGYVSTRDDSHHPSAIDLVQGFHNPPLHCAGRLDADTTGLLLLTNDGQWSHQVSSPNRHKQKVYLAQLAEPIDDSSLEPLRKGVHLKGEEKPCRPAKAICISPTQVELMITEGKYHQVKRMFAVIGNKVSALHRQQVGPLKLEAELSPGGYRELTDREVLQLGNPNQVK